MRIQGILAAGVALIIIGGMAWFTYKTVWPTSKQAPFKTQKAQRRDICNVVHAEGSLEANKTVKIGPLITAKVKKIYVKEGDSVTKGTLLIDLDNDKGGDADFRQAQARLEQAQSSLKYVTANFTRERSLFQSGQRSKDAFEKATDVYKNAYADVRIGQAAYDKELFLLEQTHIRAPHDGKVVAINVDEGSTVSPSITPVQVLVEIAQDLEIMKATLYIDESKVGDIQAGMTTDITVDTYPHRQPWTGTIDSISLSSVTPPSALQQQGVLVVYKAIVRINNTEGLLRPGMTVHAKTTIAQAKQALALPGFVFQLNGKVLEGIAKVIGYGYKPIDAALKQELMHKSGTHPVKTLWIAQDKMFIEKTVEIGVTDNAYFQILSGLQESDNVIADDMTTSDEMKKIAKQLAGS